LKLKKKNFFVEYRIWSKRKKKLVLHRAVNKLHHHAEVKSNFEFISSIVRIVETYTNKK